MNWQVLIILSTLFNALGVLSLRVLARQKETSGASLVMSSGSYVGIYGTLVIMLPFFGRIQPQMFTEYWWRFLIGGIAFALTNVFVYKTLVYFDAAIANIVSTIGVVFVVIGSAIFLNEDLTSQQYFGAFILLFAVLYGVFATHIAKHRSSRRSVKLGLLFAFLSAIFFSIGMVNEKSLLGHMHVGTYVLYGVGFQFAVVLLLTVFLQRHKFRLLLDPHIAGWCTLSGALRGIAASCVILTEVKSNNVALASVISNFRMIIVIILGALLLKEYNHLKQKFAAAAVAMTGLVVMFWK